MNNFGTDHAFFTTHPEHKPLQWTFEDCCTEAVFLDLRISPNQGIIATNLYEKELNLYLYIPATSCHPASILKSIIFGAVHCVKVLNSSQANILPCIKNTFLRLLARGYSTDKLKPLFQAAITKILQAPPLLQVADTRKDTTDDELIYFQLQYNPLDPTRHDIHHTFTLTIVSPPKESHISQETSAKIRRLQICYKKQKALETFFLREKDASPITVSPIKSPKSPMVTTTMMTMTTLTTTIDFFALSLYYLIQVYESLHLDKGFLHIFADCIFANLNIAEAFGCHIVGPLDGSGIIIVDSDGTV